MNIYSLGSRTLIVNWYITSPDGTPFNLSSYDCVLRYRTTRGVATAQSVAVSGNHISWTFTQGEQSAPGRYILELSILTPSNSEEVCRFVYHDVFELVPSNVAVSQPSSGDGEIISIYSVNTFEPHEERSRVLEMGSQYSAEEISTQEQLDEMGLTMDVIRDIYDGKYSFIKWQNNLLPIQGVSAYNITTTPEYDIYFGYRFVGVFDGSDAAVLWNITTNGSGATAESKEV